MSKCFKKIRYKRLFLPFTGLLFIGFYKPIRDLYYLPLFVFFSCFTLFWNFPKIVTFSIIKPNYLDDLFIDKSKLNIINAIPEKIKFKFIELYEWILILTSSLLLAFLSDYWLIKYEEKDNTKIIEIIGTLGGILKIYQMVNRIIAKFLLLLMKKRIEKKKKEYRINEYKKIALTSVLNDEFKDIVIGCNNAYDILKKIKEKKYHSIELYEVKLDKNLFKKKIEI